MRLPSLRLRRWQFNAVAAVSFVLLGATGLNCYLQADRSYVWQVGHVDFVFQFSTLRIHQVLPPEQAWRDRVAERETIEHWFEARRAEIDRDVQRLPWGTPGYQAALARFEEWRTAHNVYQKSRTQLGTWQESGFVVPLVWLMIPEAVFPGIVLYRFSRRAGRRLVGLLGNRFRWKPYRLLSPAQRFRRRIFVGASTMSLLLAIATAVFWIRSYLVMDSYHRLTSIGGQGSPQYAIRQFSTFKGGFEAGVSHYRQPGNLVPGSVEVLLTRRTFIALTAEAQRQRPLWGHQPPDRFTPRAWPAVHAAVGPTKSGPRGRASTSGTGRCFCCSYRCRRGGCCSTSAATGIWPGTA